MNTVFHDHLCSLYTQRNKNSKLSSWNDLFWIRFLELGLPGKEQESFQYFPLQSLYANAYDMDEGIEDLPVQEGLVFVNGQFRKERSTLPKGVVVTTIQEAITQYGAFLRNRWRKQLQEEKNPLVFASLAFSQNGLFIYVPPKVVLERPLEIIHIVTKENLFLAPTVFIYMGQHSQAEFYYRSANGERHCWRNDLIDVTLDEGASFRLWSTVTDEPKSCFTSSFRASVKRDAKLEVYPITTGSKAIRYDYYVTLIGENSEATLKGLSTLTGDLHSHVHGIIEHIAPHTQSMQLFKTVARGRSKSSFQGKIVVQDTAQKTQAYQLSKQLLLGEHAICNVKPNLEIFADDVKASHGATICQLSEEELFYLRTRGILANDAARLFVEGFCREITQCIPNSDTLLESCL